MKISVLFIFLGIILSFSKALADTEVTFTDQELAAAFVLIRPELNSIQIDGQTGIYTPAPALHFFGVNETKFEINFKGIINLADINFKHLKSKAPVIQFRNNALEIVISTEDQNPVIESNLGSIGITGVTLRAVLGFETRADGTQALQVTDTQFDGRLSGTGALRSSFILNKVRNLMLNTLTSEVTKILEKRTVQDSVQQGLLSWAKFYTGTEFHSVTPGSILFLEGTPSGGLRFKVL